MSRKLREQGAPPGSTFYLDDDTIHTVVQRKGVVALHFMSKFVCYRCKADDVTVSNLVDEIDYFKRNNWIDYVALGPDYLPQPGNTWARGIRTISELRRSIVIEMILRGYSDEDIKKVLGLNLLRLYERVWVP
jgi:membrane dipeptidase